VTSPRLDAPTSDETPVPDTAWWGVHAARYQRAVTSLSGPRVLDIACGTGYGLAMLREGGFPSAVGVDIELPVLAAAGAAAPVVQADAAALPFRSGAFDAVTSFETIEHLHQRVPFLTELARVMAPDARLMLSTPNARYTRPVDGRPTNPFHVFEYTAPELLTELREHFTDVVVLGQHLSERVVVSPFYDDQQRLPRTGRVRVRLLLWRVLAKLPKWPRNRMSRMIWGHDLYPGADDYVFTDDVGPSASVLLAEARPARSATALETGS
jgi:SAM-dependent methyltransferase